ncbi:hypothetical protein LCGC14_1351110 [marine sediment metagenome]|uniref:Uncharacterized protein n=1 Tax=marine sediment metagenome TaxID=412755 RepID=A0A0F9KBL8_9ZZZZ
MILKLQAKTTDKYCTYWAVAENVEEAMILEFLSTRIHELDNIVAVTPFMDEKKRIQHSKGGRMLPTRLQFSVQE